jgi:hypothetical protein
MRSFIYAGTIKIHGNTCEMKCKTGGTEVTGQEIPLRNAIIGEINTINNME